MRTIEVQAQICKVDEDKRLVFGLFSVVTKAGKPVEDDEGDMIPPDELEKAAYSHVLDARIAGENHVRKGVGRLVESVFLDKAKAEAICKAFEQSGCVVKIDMGGNVGWWGGYYVDDDAVWKAVKEREYVSFSIGGNADRVAA